MSPAVPPENSTVGTAGGRRPLGREKIWSGEKGRYRDESEKKRKRKGLGPVCAGGLGGAVRPGLGLQAGLPLRGQGFVAQCPDGHGLEWKNLFHALRQRGGDIAHLSGSRGLLRKEGGFGKNRGRTLHDDTGPGWHRDHQRRGGVLRLLHSGWRQDQSLPSVAEARRFRPAGGSELHTGGQSLRLQGLRSGQGAGSNSAGVEGERPEGGDDRPLLLLQVERLGGQRADPDLDLHPAGGSEIQASY